MSDGEDRLLLTETLYTTGTDMPRFFQGFAHAVDAATGTVSARLGGGGQAVLWTGDLRRVLVVRDRGEAGLELVDADGATGAVRPVLAWRGPASGKVRVASRDCMGNCTMPYCQAGVPLAAHASIAWDGRTDAYDVGTDATVGAIATQPDGTVRIGLDTGQGGVHHAVVDLPDGFALPVAEGDPVRVFARQQPVDGAAAGQVFGLCDPQGVRIALFVGGTLAAVDGRGWENCPGADLSPGHTPCAPDVVDGCGPVQHPPVVIDDEMLPYVMAMQAEPGARPGPGTYGWMVLASDRPLDGGCAALPSARAHALWVRPGG